MGTLKLPIIFRELAMLPNDYQQLVISLQKQVTYLKNNTNFQIFNEVIVIGAGDSYCASISMSLLFQQLGIEYKALSPFEFIHYHKKQHKSHKQLLVAISASGNSPIILEGLLAAKEKDMNSLIITGNSNANSMLISDLCLVCALKNKESSLGIRSYQASLLALAILSQAFITNNSKINLFVKEVNNVMKYLEGVIKVFIQNTSVLAPLVYTKTTMIFLGAGPNLGTAKYAAAKIIEGTGIPVLVQDLEEWWHIERFAAPYNMDIFIFAPRGNSLKRAVEIAEKARELGRKPHLITNVYLKSKLINIIYFKGDVKEAWTPLLLGNFGSALAGHIAQQNHIRHFRKTIE